MEITAFIFTIEVITRAGGKLRKSGKHYKSIKPVNDECSVWLHWALFCSADESDEGIKNDTGISFHFNRTWRTSTDETK